MFILYSLLQQQLLRSVLVQYSRNACLAALAVFNSLIYIWSMLQRIHAKYSLSWCTSSLSQGYLLLQHRNLKIRWILWQLSWSMSLIIFHESPSIDAVAGEMNLPWHIIRIPLIPALDTLTLFVYWSIPTPNEMFFFRLIGDGDTAECVSLFPSELWFVLVSTLFSGVLTSSRCSTCRIDIDSLIMILIYH